MPDRTPQNIKACHRTLAISKAQRPALCWYSPSGLLVHKEVHWERWDLLLPRLRRHGERRRRTMWAQKTGPFLIWHLRQMKPEQVYSGPIHWCATSRERWITQTVFAQLPGGRARSNTSMHYRTRLGIVLTRRRQGKKNAETHVAASVQQREAPKVGLQSGLCCKATAPWCGNWTDAL